MPIQKLCAFLAVPFQQTYFTISKDKQSQNDPFIQKCVPQRVFEIGISMISMRV